MCTLIALHRCVPGHPIVIGANRDEFLDRPAAPPALRIGARGPIVAPLDRRAGGTWLGVNPAGVFAALTNRPTARPDPARRSRGWLVIEALAHAGAREAAEAAARLPAEAYNPFNLFVADADEAFVVVYEGGARLEALAPGAHVVGNADPDDRAVPKVARILAEAERVAAAPPETQLLELAAVCRSHARAAAGHSSREDACMHLGDVGPGGYGTRSSALLRLGRDPAAGELWWAEGPPCSTRYEDRSHLLRGLGRGAAWDSAEASAERTLR